MRYHAKYDQSGEKVYEVIDGEVIVDKQTYGRDAGFYVMPDIQPYRAMGGDVALDGNAPVIKTRSQHQQYLRRNGYVEVGNDPIREAKRDSYNSDEVKREIARHLYN